jgi:SSS family solute:Na+ symporter
MNMHVVDWLVVILVVAFFIFQAWRVSRGDHSVSSFLAANRCANRYLLTVAEGIAGLGTISIIATFQIGYKVGFASNWWGYIGNPVNLALMMTGWVIYRFRQTRSLTMAEFFEKRYSHNFRIFAGTVCAISGVLNFGIFPAVAANFFINFCGLPKYFNVAGLEVSTYCTLVVALVGIATYFVFFSGQIGIIVTDFFQSFFCNIFSVTLLVFLLIKFPFQQIFEGLQIAPPGKSMINPFDAGQGDFNPWYFVIGVFGLVFNRLSWQGTQAFNSSAKTPHEAKMAGVLSTFRCQGFQYSFALIPLVAYMIMHHPEYTEQANAVLAKLATIPNEQVRDQMLVPATMNLYLPIGLTGAFVAMMIASFIGTTDSYMHSWGSIIVQDVVIPMSRKTISPRDHMRKLRWSMLGVGLFITLFSCFFEQTQHIYYWFALTGAIWLGGAGAVIIGGLYTTWGNTRGAYGALITGSLFATGGVICEQVWKIYFGKQFFLTGQEIYFCSMLCASLAYITFSFAGKREKFNLEQMLNRNEKQSVKVRRSFKEMLGITDEFTRGDKIIYGISIGNGLFFFLLWCIFTTVALLGMMNDSRWVVYFKINSYVGVGLSLLIAVWLSWGGLCDYFKLKMDLKNYKPDDSDDGIVRHKDKDDLVKVDQ